MKAREGLTDTQARLLEFIRDYLMRKGYAPTLREMMTGTGIPSTSVVSYNLDRLEEKGYLHRRQAGQRAIALTNKAEPLTESADLRAVIEARAEGLRAALSAAGDAL